MIIPVPFHDYPITEIQHDYDWEDLPPGWQSLYDEIWWFLELLGWGEHRTALRVTVKIEKGLLRLELTDPKMSELDRKLINRISQSIASSSAKLCLVCGKHGFRRKNEEGWPCLCSQHYIQFANELAEKENGTNL